MKRIHLVSLFVMFFPGASAQASSHYLANCLHHLNQIGIGPEFHKGTPASGTIHETASVGGDGELVLISKDPTQIDPNLKRPVDNDGFVAFAGDRMIKYTKAGGCQVTASGTATTMDLYDKFFQRNSSAAQLAARMKESDKPTSVAHIKMYCDNAIKRGEIKPAHHLYRMLTESGAVTVPAGAPNVPTGGSKAPPTPGQRN